MRELKTKYAERCARMGDRARLQNLGFYPPDRVTGFDNATDPRQIYQHVLALGAYLEKERPFTNGRLGGAVRRFTLEKLSETRTITEGAIWEDHARVVAAATRPECQMHRRMQGRNGARRQGKAECPDCFGLGLQVAYSPVFFGPIRPHLFKCIELDEDVEFRKAIAHHDSRLI